MARRSDIITSDDSAALLWIALSGEVIRRFEDMRLAVRRQLQPRWQADRDGKRRQHGAHLGRSDRQYDTVLKGHSGSVLSAAFSPHADRIATASADNTARIWDEQPAVR